MRLRVDYWEAMRMARAYAVERKAKGFTMDVNRDGRIIVRVNGNTRGTCIGTAPSIVAE